MNVVLARKIARFNKRVTNRLTRPLARYLPGFGVVAHVGRRSGRRYATPVNVFRAPAGFVIAVIYGTQSDWVLNVLAAGGGELTTGGRRYVCTKPEIVHDESRRSAPAFTRPILHLIGAADFMHLHCVPAIAEENR
jgi:deazaflavin-dependent oxidoreductase (nitroreductase family)